MRGCVQHAQPIAREPKQVFHDGIEVTETAALYIQKQINKRGKGIGIRITVRPTGCSGLQYVLDYVDQESLGDQMFPFSEQLSVYVDIKSLQYIKGSTLDLVRRDFNESLELKNPRETSRCGCGRSFSV
ncbi:MAG: iron-sulfur cluster assembly accessory protein [Pseudomonadota bacterium]|nr:iron-sulfur cluster assembly accessory protein [Gammaproteobacteria bacterium]MBU1927027.1 iron-sulfur cluster assembly accessory protein [Gammaproteobacteria bacterium]MBU2546393.1 iron-sulfur cluster assembly accessory protein [Gammaproteobacteria bacterium]